MVALIGHSTTNITDDDETMLTTQDIAVINENMPQNFDVVINEKDGKYTIQFIVNNREQQLVTWSGRIKVFKTFETVLTCIYKYCFNARTYSIRLEGLQSDVSLVTDVQSQQQSELKD